MIPESAASMDRAASVSRQHAFAQIEFGSIFHEVGLEDFGFVLYSSCSVKALCRLGCTFPLEVGRVENVTT